MVSDSPDTFSILLVEDDEIDALAMRRAFKIIGFDGPVAAVTSLEDARERLERESGPDLVLLDLSLAGESGIELLADLCRRDSATPPIVVLTSSDAPRDRENCRRNGAAGYFVKPTNMQGLKETLLSIIGYWTRSLGPSS